MTEHEKLEEVRDKYEGISEFLDWIEGEHQGQLLRWDDQHQWVAIPRPRRALILDFLGIEYGKLIQEAKLDQ